MPIMETPVTALDEPALERLVTLFYGRVRRDPLLAPVFEPAIADWDAHAAKLVDFWHSVMLTSGRYKGPMMASHLRHRARIAPAHVARWLELWREATAEALPPAQAEALRRKAERIAESLSLALFFDPARPRAEFASV